MTEFQYQLSRKLAAVAALFIGALIVTACGSDGSDGADGEPSGPIIANISTVGSPIYPGGQMQIYVSANSPSGRTLSYDWTIPDGWAGTDTGDSTLVLTAPDSQAEQGEVIVAVSDGTRSRSASVQVATRGPVVESFSATFDEPVTEGDVVTFTVDAYNRDGRLLIYNYAVGGTLILADRGSDFGWTASQRAMGGRYLLEVTAEDGDGLRGNAATEATMAGISVWPAFGGDRQRTGLSPSAAASGAVGNKIWDSGMIISQSVLSSPALGADGTVFVGSDDNNVYALNPDGTEKWAFPAGSAIRSSPALGADATVYVGSFDHDVYAINSDGTEKWTYTTDGPVESSPALGADGTIYVGSNDNKVYALNPDGSQKWVFETGGDVQSSPALGADGTVYVGSQDRTVYALNPDGTQKWAFTASDSVYSSPAIGGDGTIYVGSLDGNVYALNADGTQKWTFPTGNDIYSSPAVGADGTIYVGSNDNKVYALNPDGTEKWAFTAGGAIRSAPALGADGTVYVGSFDNTVYAINSDGTEKWTSSVGGQVWSSPALGADGTVYVGSNDNKVYAIR